MAEYIERTEELMLAMNAGARAIENTKRYHGAIYTKDLFSDNSQEISYLLAAKVLREVSAAPAADVAPVVHGRWEDSIDEWFGTDVYTCSKCRERAMYLWRGRRRKICGTTAPTAERRWTEGIVDG